MWMCVCVCACMYAYVCVEFLFLPLPLPSSSPPFSSSSVCVCVVFPFTLSTSLVDSFTPHTSTLLLILFWSLLSGHQLRPTNEFFLWVFGFPIHPLRCLELDFCSSFSKVGLRPKACCLFMPFPALFTVLFPPASFSSWNFFFSFDAISLLCRTTYIMPFSLSSSVSLVPFFFHQPPPFQLTQDK